MTLPLPIFKQLLAEDDKKILYSTLQSSLIQYYLDVLLTHLKPHMGGFINNDSISLSILNCQKQDEQIHIKCAVFFEEQIGGCNCHDDPHSENGYIELTFNLTEKAFELI